MSLLPFRIFGLAAASLLAIPTGTKAEDSLEEPPEESRVSQSAAVVATSNSMTVLDDTRSLLVGDVLSFRIAEDGPDITRVVVTDSGEVEIPYIGRVTAKGLSCAAVAKRAKTLLEKDYYYNATVLLGLDYNTYGARTTRDHYAKDGKTQSINADTGYTIMGQIGSPGVYPLPQEEVFTISHAILRSGGFQRFANERRVRLLRKNSGSSKPETREIDVHEIMSEGELKYDIPLKAGDVIIVDRKLINF